MLAVTLILGMLSTVRFPSAFAQELSVQETLPQESQEESSPQETPPQEAVTEDAAVSLAYVSSVTADQEGSVLRIYGSPQETYRNQISVTASCTLILDHIKNEADLTVAEGREVRIILRGNNQLANIQATGGDSTFVRIMGEASDAMLSVGDIACSAGGSAQTGANISIENCSVFCRNLGCGADGADTSKWEGSASVAYATPGSSASPKISVCGSNLSVSGNMACGGNGARATGTWSATTSPGGYSGAVEISSSYVTVGGNLSIGGKGGMGALGSTYYNSKAGDTRSSSPVTITDNSSVNVAGNVATQPDLPGYSNAGTQNGLHGVTVTVTDSTLSAKDIASGGAGHAQVRYSVYSGSGTSYDICGTAGGNGGVLIADHAVINCERAVCGANAGDYQNYEVSQYGTESGDVESARHPQDGRGGSIRAVDSIFTIKSCAAAKGSRWDRYPNPSVYGDSTFIGGTLNGTVYGNVITTDMTSILGGGFAASDIRNSEEASCAKCMLKTDEAIAGATVHIAANSLGGTVILGSDGSMTTYLGIGKETVKITGAGVYSGTFMVKRSETLNVFQLDPYGIINVSYDGAVIKNNSYTYTNETYDYDGDFTVRGDSEDAAVTVEEGIKRVVLDGTSFDTLNVRGSSVVTLVLTGKSHIRAIHVEENASLIIEGDGSLFTDYLGNGQGASGNIEINSGNVHVGELGGGEGSKEVLIKDPPKVEVEDSHVPLRDGNGNLLYPLELVLGSPGTYTLRFNDAAQTVVLEDDETCVRKLLDARTYAIEVEREPFCFRGNVTIRGAQRIYLDDLTLYVDTSKGDIYIRNGEVSCGEEAIKTDAEVRIIQSGGNTHPVHVEKKTASIILDGVSPDIQIYLPEDFEGMIRDADKRPIQVVTVQTGFDKKELTLHLDDKAYVLTTNEKGNLSILTGRGMHRFGLTIDGLTYRCPDAVSISVTEHLVRLSDMVLVWDVSLGDIFIADESFTANGQSGDYAGAYLIVQSATDKAVGMVTADKKDASLFLSKEVDELLQVKTADEFTGSISKNDTPLYPLVVATNCTKSAVKVSLDGHEGMLQTDEDGKLYLVAAQGTHALAVMTEKATAILSVFVGKGGASVSFDELLALDITGLEKNHPVTITVGDTTAKVETDENGSCHILVDPSTEEILVTDDGKTSRYPVTDGTLGDPHPYEPPRPNPGTGSGITGNPGGTGDGSNTGGSTGGSGGGAGGLGGQSTKDDAPAGEKDQVPADGFGDIDRSDRLNLLDILSGRHKDGIRKDHQIKQDSSSGKEVQGGKDAASGKPKIIITSSLKDVRLVAPKKKNTYKTYGKKAVRLTVRREKNTDYYYKIARQGKHHSLVKWKALNGKTITVKAAPYGQRVFIRAVRDGKTTIKKTTGFVVDTAKPTIKGVKNAAIYKNTRMVLISDGSGIASVKLNGKNMPEQFLVKKRGFYHLVVTDRAGNKKQVFFALI